MNKKNIIAAMLGNALEYYDVTLYGFFATILSPIFFPSDNYLHSLMASWGAFAAGFLMRPIGGVIFGHIGDRYGRKKALLLSILLASIPTASIGFLPAYTEIGIAAPIIIVLCRLLQGVSAGGEYSGAAIFIAEQSNNVNKNLNCSFLPASSLIGALLGTFLGLIFTLSHMPDWAWRIPFLLGAIFGLIGFYFRTRINESPEFLKNKKKHKTIKIPILTVLNRDLKSSSCAFILSAFGLILFYIPTMYVMNIMVIDQITLSTRMILNSGFLIFTIPLMPLMGFISTKVGRKKIMSLSVLSIFILIYPLLLLIQQNPSPTNILIVLGIFAFTNAAFVAPSVSLLPSLFPSQERYSGLATSSGIGEAIFGGSAPWISLALVSLLGTSVAPAFYIMAFGLVALIAIWYATPKKKENSADEEYFESREPIPQTA